MHIYEAPSRWVSHMVEQAVVYPLSKQLSSKVYIKNMTHNWATELLRRLMYIRTINSKEFPRVGLLLPLLRSTCLGNKLSSNVPVTGRRKRVNLVSRPDLSLTRRPN